MNSLASRHTSNFCFGTARLSISLRLTSPAAMYTGSFPSALAPLSIENWDIESMDGLDFRRNCWEKGVPVITLLRLWELSKNNINHSKKYFSKIITIARNTFAYSFSNLTHKLPRIYIQTGRYNIFYIKKLFLCLI